ncbi:MAG: cupin domain-containing protein [Bacteroidota bacterium]|nr:cupin domain-containing protein [Bacteroidota bacterium]
MTRFRCLPSLMFLLVLLLPGTARSQSMPATAQPNAMAPHPVEIPNTEALELHSVLADRDYVLHVNLPANYSGGDKRYPVVYLLDGQWDFPLLSAIYGEQYFDGFIPAFITVGITWGGANPDYDRLRARDFTPSSPDGSANWGNAPRFLSFIRRELVPFIDAKYRTVKDERTLIGSSLGGLFTLYALFTGPDLFNHYVLTSPALQWDNSVLDSFEKEFAVHGSERPVRVFMAVGALEPNAQAFLQYVERLATAQYHGLQVESRVLDNIGHSGTKAEGYSRGLQSVFARPAIRLSSSALTPLAGSYGAGNETLVIKRDKDHLDLIRNGGPSLPLTAETDNDFYVRGAFINLHFKKDDKGHVEGVQVTGYNSQRYMQRQQPLSSPAPSHGGTSSSVLRHRLILPLSLSFPADTLSDTLTGRVVHWADLRAKQDSSRDRREILDGRTHDLASLEIHASTLDPGKAPHPPHEHADIEELVIVKEGRLRSAIGGKRKILGPGSIAMALPGDMHGFENAAASRTTYYVLKFRTAAPIDRARGRSAGGSFTVNWDTLTVQPTGKGEKRQLFDRQTALFGKFEMHATTLNAGEVSHAPHVHRQEEIILLRKGNVTMQIGDKFYPAAAGDLVFLPSGVPHALKNTGVGPCQYFALQWQ